MGRSSLVSCFKLHVMAYTMTRERVEPSLQAKDCTLGLLSVSVSVSAEVKVYLNEVLYNDLLLAAIRRGKVFFPYDYTRPAFAQSEPTLGQYLCVVKLKFFSSACCVCTADRFQCRSFAPIMPRGFSNIRHGYMVCCCFVSPTLILMKRILQD